MTASERRKARKAGELRDWHVDHAESGSGYRMVRTRTRREERRHAARMDRWASWYDSLNGAPEGLNDR